MNRPPPDEPKMDHADREVLRRLRLGQTIDLQTTWLSVMNLAGMTQAC